MLVGQLGSDRGRRRYIDATAGRLTKLRQLGRCQMRAEGTGDVAKVSLPEHRQIKQAFHQDYGRECADRLPGEQPALGARQQSMRESRADTAAIEVNHTALLTAREHDTPAKGIPSLVVDQARPPKQSKGIA